MPSNTRPTVTVALVLVVAGLAGCAGAPDDPAAATTEPTTEATTATPTSASPASGTPTETTTDGDRTTSPRPTVTVEDEDGTTLATVAVAVANTSEQRYVGLSDTEKLADGEGMLFVYDAEDTRAFVMRNMSFPLDILFVGRNGTITGIHHAAVEPNATGADLTRYRGYGQYVLEVPRGFTNRTGIDESDVVRIPAEVR